MKLIESDTSSFEGQAYRQVSEPGYEITEGRVPSFKNSDPNESETSPSDPGKRNDPEGATVIFRNWQPYRMERALIVKAIDPHATYKRYDPANETTAFREFAAIQEELSGENNAPIIRFANKYGLLANSGIENSDPLSHWLQHIHDMSVAVNLWEARKAENWDFIDEQIVNRYNHYYLLDDGDYTYRLDNKFGPKPPANKAEAASHLICQIIYMSMNRDIYLFPFPMMNKDNTRSKILFYHLNLSDSLWWSFANAVTNDLNFRKCEMCPNYFEVKAKKRRYEKRYCSQACQKRADRQKTAG